MEAEFRQRILAGSHADLYFDLFDTKTDEGISVDQQGIFMPTTEEDFEEMFKMMEEAGALQDAPPLVQPIPAEAAEEWAERLGFAPAENETLI
jgi:hypothetical protein